MTIFTLRLYLPIKLEVLLMIQSCITLRTLNHGNYGIVLIMVLQDFDHQP